MLKMVLKNKDVAIAAQGGLKSGLICLREHFKMKTMKAFVNFVLLKVPETCKLLQSLQKMPKEHAVFLPHS